MAYDHPKHLRYVYRGPQGDYAAIRQALNRRGYYDKKQLAKRAEKGLSGKCHGFDPS
jgi:hypothetical protein